MRSPLTSIALDRRIWLGTPGRVLALLIFVNLVVVWQQRTLERHREMNLLAPPGKDSALTVKGPLRYDISIGGNLGQSWAFIPDARATRLAYVVGMSQMYAINDTRPGDQTIAEDLDDMLAPRARLGWNFRMGCWGCPEGMLSSAGVRRSMFEAAKGLVR